MPYSEEKKKFYNKAFYAGARYITMRIVARINDYDDVRCFKCGYEHPRNYRLELHDKISPEKIGRKRNGRNFDDWIKVENLEILCKECHEITDGYRGKRG